MGQVYRAADTRLDRQVAIKVLPEVFASDPERVARFEREAKTLAALNHPHIAAIYGFEQSGPSPASGQAVHALVMELVEGEDLSQRIARGAMPLDEALPIAQQIADALEAAHEQGIVHRDLKPANIKVRPDGTVKVLDFGLAKAIDGGPGASGGPGAVSMSPTMLSPTFAPGYGGHAVTSVGMILGTAAYMAPEQARGKSVDKRADIWAFGAVLFEMVTGTRAFAGDDVSDVLASVLARDPDFTAVPSRVRGLVMRCLDKDPRQRLRDIGDAMSLVDGADSPAADRDATSRTRRWLGAAGWAAAGALALALAIALWWRPAAVVDVERSAVKLQIERIVDVYNRTTAAFAVSPDGRTLAYYGAGADGGQTLLVRTLATGDVKSVPNSATVAPLRESFFWSPDSKQLVRGAASGADVFDVTTGASRRLCVCRYVGGSWNDAGTILLGGFGDRSGISRLTLSDPRPIAVTTADAGRGEQDTWPAFLPDGRRFLFTRMTRGGAAATFLGTLDGQPPTRIADGSLRVIVPASGSVDAYVVGVNAAGVMAQPFQLASASVTGPAVTIVAGAVAVSASQNGVLATSTVGTRPRTIPTWFDRKGSPLGSIGDAAALEALALSADGRKLVTSEPTGEAVTGTNIWLRDLRTGARTRLTFDGGSAPVWSPDGSRLAFTAVRDGVSLPFQRAANGTGSDVPLFSYRGNAWANDWSSDGRRVIFSTPSAGNIGNDLWVAPMEDAIGGTPVPYLVAPGLQQQAQFSPDGRFVAYGSDQSGTFEIYVQPFPDAAGGKWLVSNGGGVEPRWSRDGKELFYFSGQTLMAVPVNLQPTFSNGAPVALFDAPIQPGYTSDSHRWQIAPDGTRFLLLAAAGNNQGTPLDVIVNWTALLKK